MPHLALLDGSNLAFRAYFATRHLGMKRPDGMPVGALHNYLQMVWSTLERLDPSHAAVAFDPEGGSKARTALLPQYKQNRLAMEDDLRRQWPHLIEANAALGLPLLCVDGFEADDVIATLTRQARARGWRVSIVSGDKDLMQLVGEGVRQIDPAGGKEYDAEGVRARWGVPPAQIRALLALAGDSSDNIPGVEGIGPKTAAALLAEYGTLEGVLAAADGLKQKKRRERLLAQADRARTAWRLVGLDDAVPLPRTLDELARRPPDRAALGALLDRFQLRRLAHRFGVGGAATVARSDQADGARSDRLVADRAALDALCAALEQAELIAVDCETDSLACRSADLVGLSFAVQAGEGWYLPLGHRDAEGALLPGQLDRGEALARLAPLLEDGGRAKCGHNLKFDRQVLRRAGIELAGVRYDSLLLAYLLDPGGQPPKLDYVAERYLGHRCIPFEEVVGKGRNQRSFDRVAIDRALPYAAEDAEVAWRLCRRLRDELVEQGRLARHDAIELPLSGVLAEMEWHGVALDVALLARLSDRFGARIARLEREIRQTAGSEINIHSPRQLGVLLFERLGLPGGKRTKSGQWSTTQEVLEQLAPLHEVVRLILEVRSISKLKSTYCDALPRQIDRESGRLHTSYNQAVTSTGRLSSSEPNLQNIPIRTAEGREIRRAFVAPPGRLLISADYSQIELRLMAHLSGDAGLIDAFRAGADIHRATAAAIHGVADAAVDGGMRRAAKAINFGIIYGISAFGLARQLGITRKAAAAFIDAWFARYPRVRDYMEACKERARRDGFVETIKGHRIPLPGIHDRNAMRRQYAERLAINGPLQGSAADLIKMAMIRLHDALARRFPEARLLLQVHDELLIEAPEGQADGVARLAREVMESVEELSVPLVVDLGSGRDWLAAHAL
ncbi:MAG: DNA polymerase I [Zetaproteobacteria bacterium]|nr:MAG: DNA polymerase I [Zetaproteobacteria bacterium]